MNCRYVVFVTCFLVLLACEQEEDFRGRGEGVKVSADSLVFETVFTSVQTATKDFVVSNPHLKDLVVESIHLAGGAASSFSMNIDGVITQEMRDLRIPANGRVKVWVEVEIDPFASRSSLVVSDSILFKTNEGTQTVHLLAYGQEVVLLKKQWLASQSFTKEKPYLIYDFIVVDASETLRIEAGSRLYFHKDACLLVLGTLCVDGTVEEPIVFSSDKLEKKYAHIPGQWGYIHFLPGSKGSYFTNAHIKNGVMGIVADSVGLGDDAPLEIINSSIEHVSSVGLMVQQSGIYSENSLYGDCGKNSVALTLGGEYEFNHCTFANYAGYWDYRMSPALLLKNYYFDDNDQVRLFPLKRADFNNCIIYGGNIGEIGLDFKPIEGAKDNGASYYFDHCLLKVDDGVDVSDPKHFNSVIVHKEPMFKDVAGCCYELDSLSAAKDAGGVNISKKVPLDFKRVDRLKDGRPDLGMYEYGE